MAKVIKYGGIWRTPAVQTNGFPKLMLCDDVVTGSINVRNTRLPLWAIITTAIIEGWDAVERGWSPEERYGYTKEDLAHFLYCLLEQRGEFWRLLLLLAKAEHSEKDFDCWWETPYYCNKVKAQLQNCIDALSGQDVNKLKEKP